MKKILSPWIICAGLTLPVTTAALAEGPVDGKVYGKFNTAIVNEDNSVTNKTDTYLHNEASRLGFKGETELEGSLKAIYQLEYEVAPDESAAASGTSGIFKQRNAYVGLESSVGTIFAGSHDTPFKMAQGKVDLFNDLKGGDIKNLLDGEVRANDVVVYKAPEFNGVTVLLAGTLEEGTSGGEGQSASISYNKDNLYLAVAMDKDVGARDRSRVAATYKINDLTLGALINQTEPNQGTGTKDDAYILSGAYKMGKTTLKLQYGTSEEKTGSTKVTEDQIAVGVDRRLGDKTKVFAYYSVLEDDAKPSKGLDIAYLAGGLEHKF